MQPRQKALPGSYYAKLIGGSIICILAFATILLEIFDIFHPIDIVPVNAAIHLARIIFLVLVFIGWCVIFWYGMRFEQAKALGQSRAIPKWLLFPTRWTLKNAVGVFLLYFTGCVLFQILFPASKSLDMVWIGIVEFLFASFMMFMHWIGHRRRAKSKIFVS
jgi:hypothetical protein